MNLEQLQKKLLNTTLKYPDKYYKLQKSLNSSEACN